MHDRSRRSTDAVDPNAARAGAGLARPAATLLAVLLTALLAVSPLSCSRGKGRTISVIGSTSIQPFAEMLAEEYNRTHNTYVEVQGGGSTAGLQAVESNFAEIGMCSRKLKPGEDYTPITIALDGVAVIVNLHNPVQELKRDQIRDMFAGKITNWKQVGGADQTIRLITREEGSGTREAFTNLVMDAQTAEHVKKLKAPYKDPASMPVGVKQEIEHLEASRPEITLYSITEPSNGSVKALVAGDQAAIGYMSLGQVGHEVKALVVDGVTPTAATVLSGKYPLVRPFLFVTKGPPKPEAQEFVDFVLSQRGQELLAKEGLVPVK